MTVAMWALVMMINGGVALGLVAFSTLKIADAEQNLSLIRDLDQAL